MTAFDRTEARLRRCLMVSYDVTDLTDEEIDGLAGEAHAQSDRSERHPSVTATSSVVVIAEGGEIKWSS